MQRSCGGAGLRDDRCGHAVLLEQVDVGVERYGY